MLEFIIVYFLAKKIGGIVEAKGQRGTAYKWLTVGLWFGGEILGFMVGFSVNGPHGDVLAAYPFGLGGAIGGAAIAWVLASQVAVNPNGLWNPTFLTPPTGTPAWAQPNPALPPSLTIPGNVELVVENRAGDWAQVRAANGFSGFVDARVLIPRPGAAPWMGQP
jgi:hypothetical protein